MLECLTSEYRADNIGSMFTPDPSDPEQVLAHLAGPVREVRDALDDGISFADTKLDELPFDPYLWAHLVRYQTRLRLSNANQEGWKLGRTLPNSGIEVVRGPFVLRALKTQVGDPPHPGGNRARRNYWTQSQQLVLPLDGNGARPQIGANLILDWTVDDARQVEVALSKPVGVWKYQGAPRLEWRRIVVFDQGSELKFEPREEDVQVEPKFDLTELGDEGVVL